MSEDSAETLPFESIPLRKATRGTGGSSRTWIKPGQVLNPYGNGAPLRSLAAEIRAQTGYGRELVALLLAISRGELIKMPGKRITRRRNGRTVSSSYIRPTLDQRIDAAARLLDRGWGKAKEIIELTGEASPAQRLELLRRLSEEDRAQLRGLLQRALEAPQAVPPIVVETDREHKDSAVLQRPDSVDSIPAAVSPVDPVS